MTGLIGIRDTVAEALARSGPVVALETTVVTHGLPPPEGVNVALELEAEIVSRGAVPATIGVLDGRIQVGLTRAELERLAREAVLEQPPPAGPVPERSERTTGSAAERPSGAPRVTVARSSATKLNLSNLAAQVAGGGPGSTTVAATLFVAAQVGIPVFATGGIGGVHRGANESGDVSADLFALARYPVAVVCAGAKAVLDIDKTVEMLETLGVPILGFETDDFPAFYRRSSGLPVDRRFDSIPALAAAVRTHFRLGLGSGLVVANPIPAEHEMPLEIYEHAIASALAQASADVVRGRGVTPFLLERLRDLTASESVFSNRALLVNNARVAADLARELAAAAWS
jgi:pseudouridine-5'-phosphate glycosidase